MRTGRWSVLLVVAAVLAGCSSDAAEVVSPEPPPAVERPAPAEPGPSTPVDAVAPAPAGLVEPAAPVAPVVADPLEAPAVEDDPVPEGAPRPAARSGPAVAPAPAVAAPGAVHAATAAKTAGKPAPTGRIEIPAIGLNHVTYEGVDLGTLRYGPGHWPGTPLPGQRGNTVFPGHRTTHSRPFWDIDKLRVGHDVIFTTSAGRFTYKVTQTLIVGARDTWVVNATPDATFTILACHPKGSARQRYVVKGRLVSAPPPPPPPPKPTTPTTRKKFLGLL